QDPMSDSALIQPFAPQSCACACGQSPFTVSAAPIVRLRCHCLICQAVSGQAFADVMLFWAGAITLPDDHKIGFKRHRRPPALRRGTCPGCGASVLGFLRLSPFVQLVSVPSKNFPDQAALPAPAAHIFYHRRVKQADDALPKIEGYWLSQLAVTRIVIGSLFGKSRRGQA
ncbi:MAG: hypothetical protein ACI83P_002337, partial [Janthinobacterium sp.]